MINKLIKILFLLLIFSCNNPTENANNQPDSIDFPAEEEIENPIITKRDSIILKLRNKIENKEPLIVHLFVPLYGYNETKNNYDPAWADGTCAKTNLYWGAGYGIKTYFKKYDNWKLIYEEDSVSKSIIERVVFTKTFSNDAEVYLIADGYFGYETETCLKDYFSAITEENTKDIVIGEKTISANGNADLIVFNGHNGLLDYNVELTNRKCNRLKETAIICCGSYYSFLEKIKNFHTYPLISTLGTVPAEGYIVGSIIEPWALLKSDKEIRKNVVKTYKEIQKCSQEDAEFAFLTSWDIEEEI